MGKALEEAVEAGRVLGALAVAVAVGMDAGRKKGSTRPGDRVDWKQSRGSVGQVDHQTAGVGQLLHWEVLEERRGRPEQMGRESTSTADPRS